MKILYRPNRSSLEEAMAEVVEFDSLLSLFEYLEKRFQNSVSVSDLSIKYYCYDDRIDWDTYMVCTNRFGREDYIKKYKSSQSIGFITFK